MSERHPAYSVEEWDAILAERERNRARVASDKDLQAELNAIGWRREAIKLERSQVGARLRRSREVGKESARHGASAQAMASAHVAVLEDLLELLNRADIRLIDEHNAAIAKRTEGAA